MRITTVSNQSSVSTTTQNIANVRSPVLEVTVPRGAVYALHNQTIVNNAIAKGAHIIVNLVNAAGNKLPPQTKIFLGIRATGSEYPKYLRALPYGIWYDLSTAQQRNIDYIATLVNQTDLNTQDELPAYIFREADKFTVEIESPEVVDWAKSTIELKFEELN